MNLIVNRVSSSLSTVDDIEEIRDAFSSVVGISIGVANWNEYSYIPKVSCKMLYTNRSILLYYQVEERSLRAAFNQINDPVYKDSCVEFFISFDGRNYYNFEFNCLGTALAGYGTMDKLSRKLLPAEQVSLINTDSKLHVTRNSATWSLLANIPIAIFNDHGIYSLSGLRCTGNFYKCGDDLPTPHFVSWTPIHHTEPNFHLPQFFGELFFKK